MELKGKAAIVTGASSDDGIGSECAKILASRGCNVVVNYATNKAGGEAVAAACKAAGARRDRGAGRRLEGRGLQAAGAGLPRQVGPARRAGQQRGHHQADPAPAHGPARRRRVRAHLRGQRHRQLSDDAGSRAASEGDRRRRDRQHLLGRRHARGRPSMAYTASKAALNNLTLSMARALAPEVRVNALCPGGMLGAWTRKILNEEQYQERLTAAKTEYPLQARHLAAGRCGRGAVPGRGRHHHDRRVHPHGLRPAPGRDEQQDVRM